MRSFWEAPRGTSTKTDCHLCWVPSQHPPPPPAPLGTGIRLTLPAKPGSWLCTKTWRGARGSLPLPPASKETESSSPSCAWVMWGHPHWGGGAETEGATACTMLVGGQQGTWGQQMSLVFW